MMNLLKKRAKRGRKSSAPGPVAILDISRAIPGYKQADESVTTDSAPTASDEPVMPAVETRPGEDAEAALAQKYQDWLRRDLSRLNEAWTAVQQDMADIASFKKLHLATHDLKGMASTYGYPAISKLAHSLDSLLKTDAWKKNVVLIGLHMDACRAAANHAPTTDDEIDAVSNAVCDALDGYVSRLATDTQMAS